MSRQPKSKTEAPRLVKPSGRTKPDPLAGVRIVKLTDLRPDPRNANEGTERGRDTLRKSLQKHRAGRSLVVDRRGVVIGGNKTHEVAPDAGIDEAILIPTDGKRLIVHQRTDLDLAKDPKAAELAIADNRTAEVGLKWSGDVLEQLAGAGVAMDDLWTEDELVKMFGGGKAGQKTDGAGTEPQIGGLEYRVVVDCKDEAHQAALLERFESEGLPCRALIS